MEAKARGKRVWAFCESEAGTDTPFLTRSWDGRMAPAAPAHEARRISAPTQSAVRPVHTELRAA